MAYWKYNLLSKFLDSLRSFKKLRVIIKKLLKFDNSQTNYLGLID